jgi:acyl-[acyl-carrier-protein]-phospholipid O-acyltransferase/long-chain-fatty-acid--[acyl-carrier-protein] ligase
MLPQQLHDNELLAGNAYIEAGTFLAILLGTILGGLLVLQAHGTPLVCAALLGVAFLGYLASRYIPATAPSDPNLRISRNLWRETRAIIAYSRADPEIFLCILGISWFWLVGATLLSEFAPYVKDILHAAPAVVTLLLTLFSLGIGAGSFLCNRLLRGNIRASYVPLAALAISIFGIDLYLASQAFGASPAGLRSFESFIADPRGWRVMFDLFMMALSGGVYIVPLYAIMQHRSAPEHRARIIAANNVVNAIFMVAAALLTLGLLALSVTIPGIFLCIAVANVLAALYLCKLLPQAPWRALRRSRG